jgi:hypothetical protein
MFLNFNNGYVGGLKVNTLAYYLVNELDLEEEALVPTTNLIESVHSSMWVSTKNGCKVK